MTSACRGHKPPALQPGPRRRDEVWQGRIRVSDRPQDQAMRCSGSDGRGGARLALRPELLCVPWTGSVRGGKLAVIYRGGLTWAGDWMGDQDQIGLAEFLTDLRAELGEAQSRAADDPLKLGVEEITLTLDVAYTLTKGGEGSAGVKARFWVLASAEAGVKASVSAERTRTQTLTLTLKPRVERVVIDAQGQQATLTRGVDVEGSFITGEEQPAIPRAEGS